MTGRGTALSAIISIALVSAIGGVVFNTMPVLLGSAGEALSLDEERMGLLSSSAFFGYLIGTLSCLFWVDRVSWRMASISAALLAAGAFFAAGNVSGLALNAAWGGFGFFCALLHGLGMRMLADQQNKELAYGMRTALELAVIAVLLFFLPSAVIAKYGYQGATYALAGFILVLGLFSFLLPKRTVLVQQGAGSGSIWNAPAAGWSALAIFFVYMVGNIGLWIFLAGISGQFEHSPDQAGFFWMALKVVGAGAGVLGAVIGSRFGSRLPHILCFALVVAGIAMLWKAQTFNQFMLAAWIWEAGFTIGCLYQTAAVARFDTTNKLVVLVMTAFALGTTVGSAAAGYLVDGADYTRLYLFVLACSVLPSLAYYLFLPAFADADEALAPAST